MLHQLVARAVAEDFVDFMELSDFKIEQCHGVMLSLGKLYRFFQALTQVDAVWQIGQRVMVSKVSDSLLSFTVSIRIRKLAIP